MAIPRLVKLCVAVTTLDALGYDLERIDLAQLKIGDITITVLSNGRIPSAATSLFPETPKSTCDSVAV